METQTEQLKSLFLEGLRDYLLQQSEKSLTSAYERGRKSLQEGYSELDVIKIYHEALDEVARSAEAEEAPLELLHRASNYLVEWLAPFEIRLRSYRDLIKDLNEKNELLEEEIQSRKEIERELQRSKDRFQSLIENAQDIITILDRNGIIRYSSPAIKRILGYGQSELLGRDVFQYVHPSDQGFIKEAFFELVQTPDLVRSEEFRFRHKDGSWVYLESIAKSMNEGEAGNTPVSIVVNSRDITERKKAVQKLEQSEAQLSEAQRIAKVGSWEWIPGQEERLYWSDEMCRIYGVDPREFKGTYDLFVSRIHPDDRDRAQHIISRALQEKRSFSFEHRNIRQDDGSIHKLLCHGQVITDEEGNIIKMIGTGQDITEQKEREQKLREYSNKLRKLSARIERAREEERIRIAREVHDELGQMLTVLKMDISMLSGEMEKKAEKEVLDFYKREADDILDRINTIIKSVQRITTELRPEVLDDLGLFEAIEWQAQEFEERTGIAVEFKSELSRTDFLDEEQSTTLFRIFQETLTNIIRHARATKVFISLGMEDGHFFLTVQDNGIGITKMEKEASSSLGLIGMRERTQLLGGNVFIEGSAGGGTTVKVKIPVER